MVWRRAVNFYCNFRNLIIQMIISTLPKFLYFNPWTRMYESVVVRPVLQYQISLTKVFVEDALKRRGKNLT